MILFVLVFLITALIALVYLTSMPRLQLHKARERLAASERGSSRVAVVVSTSEIPKGFSQYTLPSIEHWAQSCGYTLVQTTENRFLAASKLCHEYDYLIILDSRTVITAHFNLDTYLKETLTVSAYEDTLNSWLAPNMYYAFQQWRFEPFHSIVYSTNMVLARCDDERVPPFLESVARLGFFDDHQDVPIQAMDSDVIASLPSWNSRNCEGVLGTRCARSDQARELIKHHPRKVALRHIDDILCNMSASPTDK
jgi:hypothetical protein